jgi:hypothetical protein
MLKALLLKVGTETADHVAPFHAIAALPTATQSDALTHDTERMTFTYLLALFGLAVIDHVAPSHTIAKELFL